jgi:hypothetical protein
MDGKPMIKSRDVELMKERVDLMKLMLVEWVAVDLGL